MTEGVAVPAHFLRMSVWLYKTVPRVVAFLRIVPRADKVANH